MMNQEYDISCVLADATYACVYWCRTIATSMDYTKLKGEYREDKWLDCLKQGGSLILYSEDLDEPVTINYSQLKKAYRTVCKMDTFKDVNERDGRFADCIIQIAAFDEVVFG